MTSNPQNHTNHTNQTDHSDGHDNSNTPFEWGAPDVCMIKTYYRFKKFFDMAFNQNLNPEQKRKIPQDVLKKIEQSQSLVSQRKNSIPAIEYPPQLPISQEQDKIKALIKAHQVVIIAGETGSGKTTQLPKICLELGYGVRGFIGHTQPRRIAARACSERIGVELKKPELVGSKIRFSDQTTPHTLIKVMTDGILLAEIAHSPLLTDYEVLIIDEAHERSLNIDFLLGYIKQLVHKRPELKVIITSATIDVETFSQHFNEAPIVQVSGRSYPVTTHYLSESYFEENKESDQLSRVIEAIETCCRLGPGNILVFFSTEKEIREAQKELTKHHLGQNQILPLYARLSRREQQRVFETGGKRRIILTTNVAETSLTVPGILFVIDTGTARVSRYNYRSKIQRLPIEAIAQSSANQRQGRCGRIAPGHCFRLYTQTDFNTRPPYTEPEILRTNLAAVILQMTALGLGNIENFDFIAKPDARYIRDGYALLSQLGALDDAKKLTPLGRMLSQFPLDPKLSRMLIAAKTYQCLSEVLILVCVLSIQDPFERPLDKQAQADEAHRAFKDPQSDFITYLNLYKQYQEQKKHLSHRKLRQWCQSNFVSFIRLQDLEELYHQIKNTLCDLNFKFNIEPADYPQIHKALLSGLLGFVSQNLEKRRYKGARNLQLEIHPGSTLKNKSPKWMMSFELIETANIYGRINAKIEPEWVEEIGGHLLKRQYVEPHFDSKRQQVVAYLRATLYGLPIIEKRVVHYGPIDPKLSREIFIKEALVHNRLTLKVPFMAQNQKLIDEIDKLEQRFRRKDLMVEDDILYEFYDSKCPADCYQSNNLKKWLTTVPKDYLNLTMQDLMRDVSLDNDKEQFPQSLSIKGMNFKLSYRFEPGHEEDGVSVYIPKLLLRQLSNEDFSWLVPGLTLERAIALLRTLPKSLRRNITPIPDFAKAALEEAQDKSLKIDKSLEKALCLALKRMTGIEIPLDAFDTSRLDKHLMMHFVIIDGDKVLYKGRTLNTAQMQQKDLSPKISDKNVVQNLEQHHLTTWSIGTIPNAIQKKIDNVQINVYPGLVDKGDTVSLLLFDNEKDRNKSHQYGILKLVYLSEQNTLKTLYKNLDNKKSFFDDLIWLGDRESVTELWFKAIILHLYQDTAIFSLEDFQAHKIKIAKEWVQAGNAYIKALTDIAGYYKSISRKLKTGLKVSAKANADIMLQWAFLFRKDFMLETPLNWLQRYPIYLQALLKRIETYSEDKDNSKMSQYAAFLPKFTPYKSELEAFYWHVEEFRVSLYAQPLGTVVSVSQKRLSVLLENSTR